MPLNNNNTDDSRKRLRLMDEETFVTILPVLVRSFESFHQRTENQGSELWELYDHAESITWLAQLYVGDEMNAADETLPLVRNIAANSENRGWRTAGDLTEMRCLMDHPDILMLLVKRLFEAVRKEVYGDNPLTDEEKAAVAKLQEVSNG